MDTYVVTDIIRNIMYIVGAISEGEAIKHIEKTKGISKLISLVKRIPNTYYYPKDEDEPNILMEISLRDANSNTTDSIIIPRYLD